MNRKACFYVYQRYWMGIVLSAWNQSDNPPGQGIGNKLGPVVNTQLIQNVMNVILNSRNTYDKLFSNLAVG